VKVAGAEAFYTKAKPDSIYVASNGSDYRSRSTIPTRPKRSPPSSRATQGGQLSGSQGCLARLQLFSSCSQSAAGYWTKPPSLTLAFGGGPLKVIRRLSEPIRSQTNNSRHSDGLDNRLASLPLASRCARPRLRPARSGCGRRSPSFGLILPVGLAVMIIAASLATASSLTARLAVPFVVALAVAGLGLAYPWRPGWATSGPRPLRSASTPCTRPRSSCPGKPPSRLYQARRRRDLPWPDRPPNGARSQRERSCASSYQALLTAGGGFRSYPLGAFLPLRVGSKLVGTDAIWLYQPMIAFYAAMLALSLGALLVPLVRSRGLRALAAFVAAQPRSSTVTRFGAAPRR